MAINKILIAALAIAAFAYSSQAGYVGTPDIWPAPQPCSCSGAGDPCRKTYLGKRFCYVNDQYACNDAIESYKINGIYISFEPCENEVGTIDNLGTPGFFNSEENNEPAFTHTF